MSATGTSTAIPGSDPNDRGAGLAELEELLWIERDLLEDLEFRLVQQQHLILASADERWIRRSTVEVTSALDRLQECEVARAACTDQLSRDRGMDPDVTLDQLGATFPEPWPAILGDHRVALRVLSDAIEELVEETERVVRLELVREASA